jgi:two-component system response regulator WspF
MRVGIVNDQQLATEVLRRIIQAHPLHQVAWTAADGEEAVQRCRESLPDVVLMDLVMPVMNGAEATRRIMRDTPCPILVVTSTIPKNFSFACEALGYGAYDAVQTPVLGTQPPLQAGAEIFKKLDQVERVQRRISGRDSWSSGLFISTKPPEPPAEHLGAAAPLPPIVAIGASTGGPPALQLILSRLPADFPAAVIVTQHIGADFVASLVDWLAASIKLKVRAAENGDRPERGTVLLARSSDHMQVSPGGAIRYTPEPLDNPFRPSVDTLFRSLATCREASGVAVLLTGIGRDGAKGLLSLRQAGWHTIAQDQSTSVVYGMPQAAADLDAACSILPLGDISGSIIRHISLPSMPAK